MFQLENVNKIYKNKETEFKALDNISLEIADQEILSIIGTSGSGKTTLLNIMSTVAPLSSGRINYNGMMLDTLTQPESADLRLHKFGFIFQKYYLLPTLNIYDNICLPLILADKSPKPDYINELCEVLELTDQLKKMPTQLSGGQQQRAAIARALIMRPEVIFADEPTGNLDEDTAQGITEILKESAHKTNKCVVVVTHSNELAKQADIVLRLMRGKLQMEQLY